MRVIKTLEELQMKYLAMLEDSGDGGDGEDEGDPGDTLHDYQVLAAKLAEWVEEADSVAKISTLLHRSMIKCSETSHASLLIPILTVMKKITVTAGSDGMESQSSHLLRRLASNLARKVLISVEALNRSHSDSVFYSRSEAKEIFEKATAILNSLCENNSDITRYIIQKFEDFKGNLLISLEQYGNKDSRNLYEAVESEEECIKENERRKDATILIQATVRMYQQKCRWKKLKHGIITLQRLLRKRTEKKTFVSKKDIEESIFNNELEEVIERRKFMERRFTKLKKLPPSKVRVYLEWEKNIAAGKIQSWWRRHQTNTNGHLIEEEKEKTNRSRAAQVIQSYVRKWLWAKQSTPAWSQLLAQRVISEERARALRLEIDVWQQRNKTCVVDREESARLHRTSQERYRQFLAGTGGRRLAEHRTGLVIAQTQSTAELLQSAPTLGDYQHQQWSMFHALPLDIATAARVQHRAALDRVKWPHWKRKIEDIIQ